MDLPKAIAQPKLFNEKADRLESQSFTTSVQQEVPKVTLSANVDTGVKIQRFGPSEEAIQAFVLTFRFFVINNESSSFRNMAKLYDSLPVNAILIQKFIDARNHINKYLDNPTKPIKFKDYYGIKGEFLIRRELFEVFMWGDLAHSNKEKKAIYDKWSQDRIHFPILKGLFVQTLDQILQAIFYIREVNREAIKELEANQ